MPFSKFNQKRFQKPIPVKEGETYEVTIESIGTRGDGIAKIEGYVVIVPQTKKGERVKIKINAIRGKVSFGEVVESLGEAEPTEKAGEQEMQEEESSEEELAEEEDSQEEKKTEEEPSKEEPEKETSEEEKETSDEDTQEEEPKEETSEEEKKKEE